MYSVMVFVSPPPPPNPSLNLLNGGYSPCGLGVRERDELPGFVCSSECRGLHQTLLIDHGQSCCLYSSTGLGTGGG